MTPDQIDLVQSTFAKVIPIKGLAAEMFYARLFQIAPEVEQMFKGDMDDQGTKLMATLAIVVNGLSDMEKILPAAQDLAARHVAYGVTPKHYQPVGEALLWTLEKGLEDAWTPAVAEAWATAYGTLSSVMVESAYPRSTSAAITAAE